MLFNDKAVTRIGIFYDGGFFSRVSNYYHYQHERRARISVSGLHEFVRQQVAVATNSDVRFCQIVERHYFRGRAPAAAADEKGLLLKERTFDDVLNREGIVTHYLPRVAGCEKGIDVWLALDTYQMAAENRFDVVVLVTSDGDFVPLVRKLRTMSKLVVVLAWDFRFTDANGQEQETRTAQVLLDEATYSVMVHQVIDDRSRRNDPLVNGLFVEQRRLQAAGAPPRREAAAVPAAGRLSGRVQSLLDGYGYITPGDGGPNIFFHRSELVNVRFDELRVGAAVMYCADQNGRGPCAVQVAVTDK